MPFLDVLSVKPRSFQLAISSRRTDYQSPRCGPSATEPEGDPGHDGDEDGDDEPPLPGLGTDPVADPLGSEPRPLGL